MTDPWDDIMVYAPTNLPQKINQYVGRKYKNLPVICIVFLVSKDDIDQWNHKSLYQKKTSRSFSSTADFDPMDHIRV